MYDYKIIEESFRQDGYYTIKVECWYGAQTGAQKHIIDCVYGKRQPSEAFKIREIERRALKLEEDINNPIEVEENYLESEITEILKEKGYLKEDEKFSRDMPIKEKEVG